MSVFSSTSIKSYLKIYIGSLPRRGRGEINKIAAYLGVSSTLVSHVLSGKKIFTLEQSHKLTSYLGLIDLEADYFMALNQLERAGTADYKKYWSTKLDKIREQSLKLSERLQQKSRVLTEQDRAIYYSSFIYVVLRLYCSVGEKGQTLQALAQRFELPPKKCAEIMHFLVETGFCYEKSGRYFMGEQSLHLEKGSPHLLRFQADWRMKSIQAAEDLSDEELMFTGPVSLSKDDFKKLREEMVQFIKKFLETVHASSAEEVACLNIDWFWVR